MSNYLFSYNNYIKMCNIILETGNLCDYKDVLLKKPEKFIILRHDVEFSPERAYKLGKLENTLNLNSTFFFQVTNNAYNSLSKINLDYIKKLKTMGHQIGLHFHLNGMENIIEIKKRIRYEIDLLSYYLDFQVDRFSFHRPTALVLKNYIELDGIINAYAPEFFKYYDDNMQKSELEIKYIADSKNAWQYTSPYKYPSEDFFKSFKKIQILCHPYSWTETGYETLENLKKLISEKQNEFIETLNSETKYVKEYLNELQN